MPRYIPFTLVCLALLAEPLAAGSRPDDGVKLAWRDGRPVVEGVFVNGRGPFRFLLDTGTTMNHIDPKLARSIGLSATFEMNLESSTGSMIAPGHDDSEIRLGSAVAANQVFLFAGMDVISDMSSDLQGILGQAFLSRFDYLLDLKAGRLQFGPCATGDGTRTSFSVVKGRAVVSTSLGAFVLDSGANSVVRFGMQPARLTHHLITASGSTNVGTVASELAIEGRTFWRGDAIALPHTPDTGAAGLLPLRLFKSVFVSNSERYVVFR